MQDVQVDNWIKQIENLESLLDATESGILIIDMDRKVRFINSKAQRLLGYNIGEVYGHRCNIIARTSDCENNCPLTRTLQTGGEVRAAEMHYTGRNNKSFQAQTSIVLLKDEAGNVVAGAEIFRDVSDLVQMEEKIQGRFSFHNIIGKSHRMQDIYKLIEEVAPTDASVLIQGESGTGKELIASAIHAHSDRKEQPFIKVNSSAFPEGLLESELFGHTRGAFTGAYQEKKGKFEVADGGTIFLDEIGEMSPMLQVKLLRILQDGEFQRVGENRSRKVDVRVVAATNKDLKRAIADKEFREDLYYRLNVVPVFLPPLRDRKTDIPLLITHFLKEFNRATKEKYVERVSSKAIDILMRYNYPGNVRELQNILEFSYIRCNSANIEPHHLPTELLEEDMSVQNDDTLDRILRSSEPLRHAEKEIIERVLEEENGVYLNAARRLGMSRTTLWRKLKDLQIESRDRK
jgi:sigma-54 dependent transcriptional regulator, acetoin dehydrogenase operon transcriptional activator AcoR